METPEEVYKKAKKLSVEQYWEAVALDLDKFEEELKEGHPEMIWNLGTVSAYHTGLIAGILSVMFELDTIAGELGVKEVEYIVDESNQLIEAPDCEL